MTAAHAEPDTSHSLRASVIGGARWKAISLVVMQASQFGVGILLARILSPHDFGVAGMVLVFSGIIIVFSDLALGAALVQRERLTDADLSTAFWISVGTGALFSLLGIAASGPVARFYHTPEVKPLLAALSLNFVVTSVGATQTALLTREMNFRALELRLIVGTVAGAATGITLALLHFGPWAIIGQQIANAAFGTLLLWTASSWRPRFILSSASLRSLGGFSVNVFGQRLLYFAHRNTDNLLIGRFAGPVALGAYALSYNIILLPFSRIAVPVQQLLYPAFSRKQSDRSWLAATWVRVSADIGAISTPALAGLIVVAPDFVQVVLGPKWNAAVPLIRVLAVVALIQSLQTLNSDLLQAIDRTRLLFRYSVFAFCAHITAFAVGVHWGALGVAVGYLCSSLVVEPIFTVVTARALGVGPLFFARGLARVIGASALMALFGMALRDALIAADVATSVRLVATVCLSSLAYLGLVNVLAPQVFDDLRSLRDRRGSHPFGDTATA